MRPRSVVDDPAFQRAFLAVAHLLGARDSAPLSAFQRPSAAANELARELSSEERAVRARALGRELEGVARRLAERRLA